MKNNTYAAIDIGTNTVRLLIAKVHQAKDTDKLSIEVLHANRIITRLGSGLSIDRNLQEDAIDRGIEALKKFAQAIENYDVKHVSAIATSALRNAANSSDFINLTKEKTGIDINVISGEEEAELTAEGMLFDINVPASALMIDIGGGSTELIFSRSGEKLMLNSLDLGVVYLTDRFMNNDPPSAEDLKLMETEILKSSGRAIESLNNVITADTILIGTAGTITALAAIALGLQSFSHEKVHKFKLSYDRISELFTILSEATSQERSGHIFFESERLDIIVPGTLIILLLMKALKFDGLIVSDYGLMEGILLGQFRKDNERYR